MCLDGTVTAAGYRGYVGVEIFNAGIWAAPADQTAATVRARFAAALGPGAPSGPGTRGSPARLIDGPADLR